MQNTFIGCFYLSPFQNLLREKFRDGLCMNETYVSGEWKYWRRYYEEKQEDALDRHEKLEKIKHVDRKQRVIWTMKLVVYLDDVTVCHLDHVVEAFM